jgi:hypothetical protein
MPENPYPGPPPPHPEPADGPITGEATTPAPPEPTTRRTNSPPALYLTRNRWSRAVLGYPIPLLSLGLRGSLPD